MSNEVYIMPRLLNSLTIILTALLLVIAPVATAQDTADDIRSMLVERDREIKSLLGEGEISDAQREELRAVINGVIDFRTMAAEALGPHWDDLTDAQRTKFVDVFSEIVRHQSLADLEVYRSSVTYDTIKVDGNTAHVVTTTVYDDVPTAVEYHMIRTDKGWMARDIVLDEVSTVEGYSRSFQTFVRKRGFDALMDNLNRKLEKIRGEG